MSRTIRKPAYCVEHSLKTHLNRNWGWYRRYSGTKWVYRLLTEEEYKEAKAVQLADYNERLVKWEKDYRYYARLAERFSAYHSYLASMEQARPILYNPRRKKLVQVPYSYEEWVKDETETYKRYLRDGCDGMVSRVRGYAVDGKISGWGDSAKSYKKTVKRIARRQLKEMLKKEISDVVDFDL